MRENDQESFRAEVRDAVVVLREAIHRAAVHQDHVHLHTAEVNAALARILVPDLGERLGRSLPHVVAALEAAGKLFLARHSATPYDPTNELVAAVGAYKLLAKVPGVEQPMQIRWIFAALDGREPDTGDEPDDLSNAASTVLAYAMATEDESGLPVALALYRRAIAACPPGHPYRRDILNNYLGALSWWHAERTAEPAEEQEVAKVLDELQQGEADDGDGERAAMRAALVGGVLVEKATRTHDLATFDEAISTLREALAAMPDGTDGKAGFAENLGRAHLNRWLVSRNPDDHAEAVSVLLESVRLTDADDPFRVRRMGFLAHALMAQDSSANKEKVLSVLQEMSEIGPGIRPSTLAMLANSWYLAWIRFKDSALLDTVIDLVKQVGDSERGVPEEERSRRLGDVLWARWAHNRVLSDIDEIIAALGSQLSGMELGDPEALNLLARAMRARWESSGDSVAIEHAAALLSLAVEHAPAGSPGKAMYLNNLASVLLRAGTLSRDRDEIARAVELSREAVAVALADDPGLPMYLHNHSAAHGLMWQVTRERAWLVDGLRLARRAVGATPEDHPDRLGHLSNLGGLLLLLGSHDGDLRLVEEAVTLLAPCADPANASDPAYGMVCIHLAHAFQRLRGTDADDAGLDSRARALFREASHSVPPRTADLVTFRRLWGGEAADAGDWPEAARALTEAIGLLADHLGPRVSRVDQERSLADFSGLATDAAAACLAVGCPEDAVEALEKGRGVLLAQSLRGDDEMRRLDEQHPELARRIEHLRTLLAESRDLAL
ncbi:tetratricopeptide (TPR) repeat protein [Streptomyces sp. SAI-119]|uniref:hypothetical protein n=1 Tax=Streptomyces sp. SAI-119 TaxID=2940541 RepID=UPI0024751914|nr:hypothetical protein [Streptomyces sp. SAI-119]MDH6450537.1 tetratricopeptide (TPR) repeat protein [Streptomyces sp. SAI-119]